MPGSNATGRTLNWNDALRVASFSATVSILGTPQAAGGRRPSGQGGRDRRPVELWLVVCCQAVCCEARMSAIVYSSGYELRRLCRHRLMERIPQAPRFLGWTWRGKSLKTVRKLSTVRN